MIIRIFGDCKMKQIKHTITINYNWWRENGKHIKPEHVEALDEKAMIHIAYMMNQGCVSGELNDDIAMTDGDGDGVEYTGWWEMEKV